MKTKQIEVRVDTDSQYVEPAIAWLQTVGFHGFEETQKGVKAYIESNLFEKKRVEEALSFIPEQQFQLSITEIEARNWNEEWEASWKNVEVDDFCQVIPSFRSPNPGFAYTLVVDPKMAFGTGHHETTRSVIRLMRKMDWTHAHVLDMGCGTGILGILARKMGASSVFAIDIDIWSVENTEQNSQLNNIDKLKVVEGTAQQIPDDTYDVIFANINKNVLLEDIPTYARHLRQNGTLLLSGFYTEDEPEIIALAEKQNLNRSARQVENNWVAVALTK